MEPLGVVRGDGPVRCIRFERRYSAVPDAVWAALTEPEQVRGWLADAVEFEHRVGGRVDLRFGEEADQVAQGSVIAFEPPHLLEYEWHWPGQDTASVRFELEAEGDGTLLTLEHRGLPTGMAPPYAAGWHAYLDRLSAQFGGVAPDWDARFSEVLPAYRGLSGA